MGIIDSIKGLNPIVDAARHAKSFILVISSCHVLATIILFCGIRGKYSKVSKRDIENLDPDTNLKTQLETIKNALRRMLIQTRLRKQVCSFTIPFISESHGLIHGLVYDLIFDH